MKLSHPYTNRRARIEMIPLIDIVFLLLVFFIYAMLSMAVHRGVKVDLPSATTAEVDDRDHISISIDRQNQVFLNKQPVALADLPQQIRARRKGKKDMPVFISGDRSADLGVGIEVLDLLRKDGIERVSFQAKRKQKTKPNAR
ncbi:MAG: biopolymer transporter ExbD [Planctomycetes bacterium]|nr:biopolymer transporter ExbD [Planctomycetota bacterium]